MRFETKNIRASVREGYQILLRADAEVLFPTDFPIIRDYYLRLSEVCVRWATEVHGEALRNRFRRANGIAERSRFGTERYRFGMTVTWDAPPLLSLLCETELCCGEEAPRLRRHRIARVWNTDEQTVLPDRQVLRLFPIAERPKIGKIDGLYPEGGQIVFYRNSFGETDFSEERVGFRRGEVSSADP